MTAPAWTEADHRIAKARKNVQKFLHGRVDEATQRIYHDASFFADANVIPIRAGLIGQVVHSAQQLLVHSFNDQISHQLGLDRAPTVSPEVFARPGVDKTTEYSRPFFTALQLVRGGKSQAEGMSAGSNRLRKMTATDLQMAKVRQARIALKAAGRKTFRRVITSDKPCELCELAADQIYYTEDLMPIHPDCSCDIEADEELNEDNVQIVDDSDQPDADDKGDEPDDDDEKKTVDDIAIREHGEIGPLLTWVSDHFTGPGDLPNPPSVIASETGGEQRGPAIPASVYDRARAHLDAINARLAQRAI
jgi:hypothetical protein